MEKKKLHRHVAGLPPGTLRYVGEAKQGPVLISVIDYNEEHVTERNGVDIQETYDYKENGRISWINIDGVHDVKVIKTLGLYFNIHPLLQEDIADTDQRPKAEFYEDVAFVVLHMLSYDRAKSSVEREQVSLVLGDGFLLSFQEDKAGDVFEPVRERIRKKARGKLRNLDTAYLFYVLMDTIVDNYLIVLENVVEDLERLEEKIIKDELGGDMTRPLYEQKQELIKVRKAVRPLRDIVSQLIREESTFLDGHKVYLRDLYDHVVQVIDNTESYIDTCNSLLDMYLSIIGNRTNDVMKVLTILSTIFLPLTFIVGVYGMNFDHMPELHTPYGYLGVWALMVLVSGGIYGYFRRKRWI